MGEFLDVGMPFRREGTVANGSMWIVPENHRLHSVVDLNVDRESPQGTSTLKGGTVHHLAFSARTEDNQLALKARQEGIGYTDVNEQKDRN